MKTTIFSSLFFLALLGLATSASAGRILVDFGPANDDDGRATASPDTNGNYWNSWRPLPGSTPITIGETLTGLVDSTNSPVAVELEMTNSFDSNGIVNGGLLAPNPALLGDFAIDTATEDYWFESTGGAAIRIYGLNPSSTYDLLLFGTRETTSTRITTYTVLDGSGSQAQDLQTSGAGIGDGGYNGNNDTIITFSGLIPDGSDEINLDVAIKEGGFAYLGIMELVEHPVPEPASFALMGLSGLALMIRRRGANR